MMGKIGLQTNIHFWNPFVHEVPLSHPKMTGVGHLWTWSCVPALEGNAQCSEGLLEWVSVEDRELGIKVSPVWL